MPPAAAGRCFRLRRWVRTRGAADAAAPPRAEGPWRPGAAAEAGPRHTVGAEEGACGRGGGHRGDREEEEDPRGRRGRGGGSRVGRGGAPAGVRSRAPGQVGPVGGRGAVGRPSVRVRGRKGSARVLLLPWGGAKGVGGCPRGVDEVLSELLGLVEGLAVGGSDEEVEGVRGGVLALEGDGCACLALDVGQVAP